MPPDVTLTEINLDELQEHYFWFEVKESNFIEPKKTGGRKIWMSFIFESVRCSKIFHLSDPLTVLIDNHHYFQETLSKGNKEIGHSFKKFNESHYQFLRNTNLVTAARSYHDSHDDHPNFLSLKKEYKKLWIN